MRRKVDRRVALLETLSFFDGCSKRQLEQLARAADEVQIPSGETVVTEGRTGHHFYLLAEGMAHASIDGRRVGTIKPGSFFGEMAILDGNARSATVITALPSRMLVLDARQFRRLLDHAPTVAQRVMRGLSTRLRETEEALLAS
jgi:CRP-like cAMP-binding protein